MDKINVAKLVEIGTGYGIFEVCDPKYALSQTVRLYGEFCTDNIGTIYEISTIPQEVTL